MPVDPARAKSLFLAASDLADSAERAAFLDRECGGDVDLRARVEALLRANDAAPLRSQADTSAYAPDRAAPTEDYDDPTARVGSIIAGKYKLIEAVGEGGMGQVFMAQQTEPVKRAVAVKVIKAGMDSKAVLARFEAERQALAMMDHPNIAKVLDAGTTDGGRPFFVMELVKGTPITQFCDERKLTPKQRLELFVPVCQAIQHAHQKGVIHRDIKPSNVLIALYDDRPVPKVIDFGVAKAAGQTLTEKTLMTGLGAVVGTAEYMSPEQASLNNLDIDTRSDVYSLGVLLYELLTGSTPVDRKSLGKAALLEILRIVREVEAPRPSAKLSTLDTLPSVAANRSTEPAKLSKLMKGELDWLLLKALEKDRTRRYETANGLARDILRYLSDEVVEARPPSTAYRLKKFIRRNKGQVIAASLVLLTLIGGIVGTSWGMLRAEDRRIQAEEAQAAEAKRVIERDEAIGKRDAAMGEVVKERNTAVAARAEAEAINRFLVKTVLGAARPEVARGREVTVAEALKKAAGLVDGAFPNQPLLEASVRVTIGAALQEMGLDAEAEPHLQKALDIRERVLPGQMETMLTMLELGIAQRELGKYKEAEVQFRRMADGMRRLHGVESGSYATALSNLGTVLYSQRRLSEAEKVYQECLAIRQRVLGPKHPQTVLSITSLALILEQQGKFAEAEPIYRQVVEGLTEAKGLDHPQTLTAFGNLGYAQFRVGKLEEAEALFRDLIANMRRVMGSEHLDLAWALTNFSQLLAALGNQEEELSVLRECLRIRQKALPAENPGVNETVSILGAALVRQGKFDEAIALYRKAIELNPKDAKAQYNLGTALSAKGDLDGAIASYRTAIRFQPDHAEAHCNLGGLLRQQGDYAGALELIRKGHELGSKRPGWRNPSAQWLASAEYELALAQRLPALLRGEDMPKDGAERLAFAQIAFEQKKYALATRLWAEALAGDAQLGDNRQNSPRDPAARAAALAAGGRGKDEPPTDEAAKAKLRGQALDWLRTELVAWGKTLDAAPSQEAPRIVQVLSGWQKSGDFAGIRDEAALARLPAAEQQAFTQLWADVTTQLKKAEPLKRAGELVSEGASLYRQRKLDEASVCFLKATELDPTLAAAQDWVASLRMNAGDAAGALPFAERAVQLDPKSARAQWNLGRARMGFQQVDKAIAAFTEALRLDPKHAGAKSDLTRAERTREFLSRLPDILASRAESGTTAETCELASFCAQKDQKRYAGAVWLYEKAFVADPKLADDRGAGHRATAARAAALAADGQSKGEPTPDEQAKARLRGRALDWLQAELAAWGKLFGSGSSQDAPRIVQALSDWQKNGDLASVRDAAALAKLAAAEQQAFAQLWADAAALLKKAEPFKRASDQFSEGDALFRRHLFDEARACFRKAIELDPKNAKAHLRLGGILCDIEKDYVGAYACFRKALEIDPMFAEAHCNLGHALRGQGRFVEALAAFKRGHELGTKRPDWPYRSADWIRTTEAAIEKEATNKAETPATK